MMCTMQRQDRAAIQVCHHRQACKGMSESKLLAVGTCIIDVFFWAASKNWRTAFGRSETGNSHQLSQDGVSGSARKVGTCTNHQLWSHQWHHCCIYFQPPITIRIRYAYLLACIYCPRGLQGANPHSIVSYQTSLGDNTQKKDTVLDCTYCT